MKRLLVTTFALAALAAAPAAAADMAVKAPVLKAPPPPPVVVTWTGCYIGANVGYGFGDKKYDDPQAFLPAGSHDINGVVGGGQIGCDYQVGNWVLGVQGLFDGASLKGDHRNPILYDLDDYIEHTKVSWFATLTGRLGYAVQPALLLYVKGGAAWIRDKHWETELSFPPHLGSASVTRTGWTVGGGFEYQFLPGWSFFAEYNFMDFGRKNVTLNYTYDPPSFTYDYRINQQVQTALVGVNFRWGAASPVVARY